MAKDGKIIGFGDRICLFCGQPKKAKWEEYTEYFECDCPDAVKDRKIQEQIRDLERTRPREKFDIRKEDVLYKIRQ